MLYLIPFLHQTTTAHFAKYFIFCCILFHFYIKPQPLLQLAKGYDCCILFHFYIKPQLATQLYTAPSGCILFHFYIKPQQQVC